MKKEERQENLEKYLEEINDAIHHVMERCGASQEDMIIEDENLHDLAHRQRPLFIHTGITSLLAVAIDKQDTLTLSLYDWLLGYHVNKERNGQEDRNRFIVAILTAFQSQVIHDYEQDHYSDEHGTRFTNFVVILKLALMVLDQTITDDEVKDINALCVPLLNQCLIRKMQQIRSDVERN